VPLWSTEFTEDAIDSLMNDARQQPPRICAAWL